MHPVEQLIAAIMLILALDEFLFVTAYLVVGEV